MSLHNRMKKLTSLLLAAALVFGLLTVLPLGVSAMSGSGTEADPYVIKTAEDLNSIRNDLKGHYVLGATVDASSLGVFKPIGTLARPFTGSFTCPTDSDGKPKYAILNLKVYNDAGEKNGHKLESSASYVDYSEKNSRWEAAFFGAATGATVQGIYILNADITNTVVGQHQQNADSTWNPGQDEMNAAILIGEARECYVSGCGVTGKVTSASNHSAGLIANCVGSTVESCFSVVELQTTGFWGNGGLISGCNGSQVSYCFTDAKITGVAANTGLLCGSIGDGSMVNDCAAIGSTAVGGDLTGRAGDSLSSVSACYAIGTVTTPATSSNSTFLYSVEDSYSANFDTFGLTKKDAAAIKADFGARRGWKTVDGKAIPGTVALVTDSAAFKQDAPQPTEAPTTKPTEAPTTAPTQGTTAPTQGTTAPTQGTTAPTQGTTAPTQGTTAPTQGTTAPTQSTVAPTQKPTEGTTPTQNVQPSGEPTAQPSQEPSVPVSDPAQTVPAETAEDPVAALTAIVEGIPAAEAVTLEHKAAIMEAKKLFDGLNDAQFDELPTSVMVKVNQASSALSLLMLSQIADEVGKLPEVDALNGSHKATVEALWQDYNFLTDEYKEYIAAKLRDKLTAAYEAVANLEDAPQETQPAEENPGSNIVSRPLTGMETTVCVLLVVMIAIVLALNVALCIYIFKHGKPATDPDKAEEA